MISGTYKGVKKRLQGKHALLQDDPETCRTGRFGLLLAQFDDRLLAEAFGWHLFERSDFDIDPKGTS